MTDPTLYEGPAWPGETVVYVSGLPPSACRLRSFGCALAAAGERCYRCAPEDYGDLLRQTPVLREDGTRCLLLELPQAGYGLTPADLGRWGRRLGAALPGILIVPRREGGDYPCGRQPACRGCAADEIREFNESVSRLDVTARDFRSVLRRRLPNLGEQTLTLFHIWCVQTEPGKPGKAITQAAVARQARCSDRTVRRALSEVRAAAPELYRQAELQRRLVARANRAYAVRTS